MERMLGLGVQGGLILLLTFKTYRHDNIAAYFSYVGVPVEFIAK